MSIRIRMQTPEKNVTAVLKFIQGNKSKVKLFQFKAQYWESGASK